MDVLDIKLLSAYWTPCLNSSLQRHYEIITMQYAKFSININLLRNYQETSFYLANSPNLTLTFFQRDSKNFSLQREETASQRLYHHAKATHWWMGVRRSKPSLLLSKSRAYPMWWAASINIFKKFFKK